MRNIIGILICFGFISCEPNLRPEKPENLLSKDQMEEVFYDMFVVNSAKGVNRKILEKNGVSPETFVLKKHGIDSLIFAKSNDYYAYDIDEYETILDNVEKRITTEKEVYEKLKEKEEAEQNRLKDSLKEARNKSLKPVGNKNS